MPDGSCLLVAGCPIRDLFCLPADWGSTAKSFVVISFWTGICRIGKAFTGFIYHHRVVIQSEAGLNVGLESITRRISKCGLASSLNVEIARGQYPRLVQAPSRKSGCGGWSGLVAPIHDLICLPADWGRSSPSQGEGRLLCLENR